MNFRLSLSFPLVCLSCALGQEPVEGTPPVAASEALKSRDFNVEFSGCTEFAGIGFVPTANARALVPSQFTLAGDATNAVIVVRVAECADVVVDGHDEGKTRTSQIGISILGGDTTAAINNYALWYSTTSAQLKAKLTAAGAKAYLAKQLDYQLSGGQLRITSSSAQTPTFSVTGAASAPTAPAVPFSASWWVTGNHGTIQARTAFPAIQFGGATTVLTTPGGSELATLIGGTSLTFPALDSYNAFATAHLEVRDTD